MSDDAAALKAFAEWWPDYVPPTKLVDTLLAHGGAMLLRQAVLDGWLAARNARAPAAEIIANPLVIMFREPDGKILTRIHPGAADGHEGYGILICDLVRHVANAFGVEEDDVWDWVDRERRHHTSPIERPS